MILIKLGGSIITNKEKPLSARKKTIDNLSKSLKKIKEPIIIVHGGGSYGHYWSVKYDMHTKERKYDIRGVSIIKNSMIELNKIILDSLLKNKLNPYSLPPTDFMSGNKPISKKINEVKKIAKSGLIPVTYGDALWFGQNKTYILSGDKIMTHFAKVLKPRLCIFALNEDGLYSDLKSKKVPIQKLQRVQNIMSNPKVAILIDDYLEDWEQLAFVLLRGQAELISEGTERGHAINLLKRKYHQYKKMGIDQCPVIKITIASYSTWKENATPNFNF